MSDATSNLPMATGTEGGCGCGCSHSEERRPETEAVTATASDASPAGTQVFPVTGMTCGHCVHAVSEEVAKIPGVSDVSVDLVAGGTSTVTVTAVGPVDAAAIAEALEEAGDYQLADA
jgi:copper chaperone CopZ